MKKNEFVEFLGWKGTDALFKIKKGILPNDRLLKRIIVAHEGDWISSIGGLCVHGFKRHEDVQKRLGFGLNFMSKEYSKSLNRSLFFYSFEDGDEATLAVPATGEEIYFEIYGSDGHHGLYLLVEQEL